MKSLAILVAAGSLLLGGCATTIRSDVTVFHQWPAELQDKTYVFDTPTPSEDTLEYRSYQGLVANELAKLGFAQAPSIEQAKLTVDMGFSTIDRQSRRLVASDPFMTSPYWGMYGGGFYGPRYRGFYPSRFGYRYYGFRPYYDPWMYGPTDYREVIYHDYERKLNVKINDKYGKKLYDVTVQNTSRKKSTPAVMPLLVQSAFTGFPGESGKEKRVDLDLQ
ncbi:uncharacterized protein DUF4136 [Pseudoduganella lurida]|uniref:Uncharacterized protein DUF4136 n=1 Tax=Pseudoduganella lurida TaxID=1036180 RepID=A0A562R5M0_9BURK|nr:DUF4136 domain-containing protein [Pseudoduganella lurida]TWI64369.1 uncharacterized protein DUF4136 [Pseudoduganella lurida]